MLLKGWYPMFTHEDRLGSDLAVPITPGGGPQSEVKLKQTVRRPTFGPGLPVLGGTPVVARAG